MLAGEGPQAWRRLHPAAIAVWISGVASGLALPLVLVVVLGGEGGPVVFTAMFGSLAVVGSVVRWARFFYRLEGRTLLVRGGLLQRWERTLPPARIQSVDVVRKLTHRVFGVVELRVEVVGGRGTEAALVALTPEDAEALRGLLLADHPEREEVGRPAPVLVRMTTADLLLAGVTGGRVAVLAAMVGWVLQVLPEGALVDSLDRLAGADRSQLETVALVAGLLLLASIVISLVSTIVVYWDFTAIRRGDRLVITRGLLQTRRSVVPVTRIQAVRIEENLIRRAFGLASLRVLTAGYGRGSGDEQQSSMLVPVAARRRCAAIAATVLGSGDLASLPLAPAPAAALWLRVSAATIVGVGALALGIVADGDLLPAALPVLPVAVAVAVLSWRSLGHAVADRHIVARWGAFVRRTAVSDQANIQHLVLRRSPLQRAVGLATLTLAIPKASASVIDVRREVAEDRFDELAARLVG